MGLGFGAGCCLLTQLLPRAECGPGCLKPQEHREGQLGSMSQSWLPPHWTIASPVLWLDAAGQMVKGTGSHRAEVVLVIPATFIEPTLCARPCVKYFYLLTHLIANSRGAFWLIKESPWRRSLNGPS